MDDYNKICASPSLAEQEESSVVLTPSISKKSEEWNEGVIASFNRGVVVQIPSWLVTAFVFIVPCLAVFFILSLLAIGK